MLSTVYKDIQIAPNVTLTIIDIDELDSQIEVILDANFVEICEGLSGSDISTVKTRVEALYSTKNDEWIMGATAEFFIHLYIRLNGYKQECLFLNLEENSIKKGFDGLYSKEGQEWLMESKAGSILSEDVSHVSKVKLAMHDLANKVAGKDDKGKRGRSNNPWQEAYSHASHCDVGTALDIRRNLKKLADEFTNGQYKDISEFNTMPCGTVFLAGSWNPQDHTQIKNQIQRLVPNLKGAQIHVVCATHKSAQLFMEYIKRR